jgi:L-amino acid N-acyltransferase YncA
MTVMEIRSAELEDAGDLLSIYRPIVEKTATSFELTPPTEKEFADRTETVSQTHTWLVAEEDSRLSGYAYATQHKPRAAYKFSVETSAYVHSDFRGSGIAGHLYDRLFDELLSLGFCHAFAGITLPNPASVALH